MISNHAGEIKHFAMSLPSLASFIRNYIKMAKKRKRISKFRFISDFIRKIKTAFKQIYPKKEEKRFYLTEVDIKYVLYGMLIKIGKTNKSTFGVIFDSNSSLNLKDGLPLLAEVNSTKVSPPILIFYLTEIKRQFILANQSQYTTFSQLEKFLTPIVSRELLNLANPYAN